jgi:hypothetical protein
LIFLGTRVLLFYVAYLAEVMMAGDASSAYWRLQPDRLWLDVWMRWDAGWYIGIVGNGYSFTGEGGSVAFFPVFPLLVRAMAWLTGDLWLAAVLVTNLMALGAMLFLFRLTEELWGERPAAVRATLYLAVYPTALFLSAVYTESTFLFFAVGAYYFARRRAWPAAALLAMLAAATRVVGIVLPFMLLLEWASGHGWTVTGGFWPGKAGAAWRGLGQGLRRDWGALLWLALTPLALLSWMLFLQTQFGDPLAFSSAQQEWARHAPNLMRTIREELIPFFNQSFYDGITVWTPMVDLPLLLLALLLIVPIGMSMGSPAVLYMVAVLAIPFSTDLWAIGRYTLVCFPMFVVLAQMGRRRWVDQAILVSFTIFLGLLTAGFVNWYFVG